MARKSKNPWPALLVETQRRLPAGQRLIQEAFTSDHRHPIWVKLNELTADTFYWLDEATVCALFDAVVDYAVRQTGAQLTVSYTAFGEAAAQAHRLQHAAGKLERIRVLTVGRPGKALRDCARLEWTSLTGSPLARYRLVLVEAVQPVLFIAREGRAEGSLGFFTSDADVVEEFADDVEALVRGAGRRLEAFEKLELLHQTTQQVARELESYARRLELAVERARRRPDLLTPARFERIVSQALLKMEELKELPRRALRTMGRSKD